MAERLGRDQGRHAFAHCLRNRALRMDGAHALRSFPPSSRTESGGILVHDADWNVHWFFDIVSYELVARVQRDQGVDVKSRGSDPPTCPFAEQDEVSPPKIVARPQADVNMRRLS